jgi:hypothetical protein
MVMTFDRLINPKRRMQTSQIKRMELRLNPTRRKQRLNPTRRKRRLNPTGGSRG